MLSVYRLQNDFAFHSALKVVNALLRKKCENDIVLKISFVFGNEIFCTLLQKIKC